MTDPVGVEQTAVSRLPSSAVCEPAFPVLSGALARVSGDVLQLLSTRLGMEICLLSLHDQGQYVVLQALDPVTGTQLGPLRAWEDTLCAVMCDGDGPEVAGDVLMVPRYRELVERLDLPVRSYIGTPLYDAQGEVIGSLCALSLHPRGEELYEHFDLLKTFGQVVGHLLDRELTARTAQLAESAALEQSRTDTLTGALNRRGWQLVLQDVDRWCRVERHPAAVFVIDLDDLKQINDTQGHDAGDALLQRAAAALTDCAVLCALRRDAETPMTSGVPSYAVARTGGDEFAVLLTRFDALQCPEVADELRRALADAGVVASLGFALRHPVRGLALACRDADQQMLAEKRHRHSRRQALLPAPRVSPEAEPDWHASARDAEPRAQAVGRLLCRVRQLFGLESAFVSRFDDRGQTFTHINTDVPLPVSVGDWRPKEASLCRLVFEGNLPHVITDATRHPASADLDVVRAGSVCAYLTVPIRLPDGRLYGSLCCLSSVARPDITEHAAAALAFAAEQVGELLAREQENSLEHQAMALRLDALLEQRKLRVALQPVVDLRSGRTVGAEALARFDDSRSPDVWFAEAATIGQSARLELAAFDVAVAG
ncbi:MAG: diguanylate cyclase, partial [Mycobacteriales bacterium]